MQIRDAREADVPLMFSLAQLSYWSARHLGDCGLESMKVRGRLQEGKVADITIFDPARIIDTATFEDELSYSEGVEFVLVNGEFVVRNGEIVEGARPGQAIVGRRLIG